MAGLLDQFLPQEAGLLGAYTGNPLVARQGARARMLASQRDVNTLPDPRTYAFVAGLLGEAPDQQGFSVMGPDAQAVREAGEAGYKLGLLGMVAPATKGLPVGASIKFVAPQDSALETARKNAVKMLGLPENNTAMQRAQAMGFNKDVYHGTNGDIRQFDPARYGFQTGNPNSTLGTFATPNPAEASRFASQFRGTTGGNVMPMLLREGEVYQMPYRELDDLAMTPYRMMMADPAYDATKQIKFGDIEAQRQAAQRIKQYEQAARDVAAARRAELLKDGYDSAVVFQGRPMEEVIALNPSSLRSRFAAFDPARRDENDLLASILLGTVGLGAAFAPNQRGD